MPRLPPPVRTPEGVASLLYLVKVKERVAGARGQSADGNYIGVAGNWVNWWEGRIERRQYETLLKTGGWRAWNCDFREACRYLCANCAQNRDFGLVRGLHIVRLFEIESLFSELDWRMFGSPKRLGRRVEETSY